MSDEIKKHPGGRPTIYNDELADLICERIATHSEGIVRLCHMYDDMPSHDTINKWRWRYKEFSDRYSLAKAKQAELLAEQIIDIADDVSNDMYVNDQGNMMPNGTAVSRAKLKIAARQWHAAKLAPQIYGDNNKSDDDKNKSPLELFALRKV